VSAASAQAPGLHLIGCGPQNQAPGTVAELGFKAYNLARLARLGVPVPPAFVLGTDWCRDFLERGGRLPEDTRTQLSGALHHLEAASGLSFGSARRPLLVSVRSGAPVSMPGMLETVLDVGLCSSTLPGFLRQSGNPHLVWDSYRRLIECYAEIVAGLDGAPFAAARREALASAGAAALGELDFRALRALAQRELELYAAGSGHGFPQSPIGQLEGAIAAVFRSWDGAKARFYREAHGIDAALGTAVTVQRMVFGNGGGTSGAGVGFTRNPATGRAELYLDYVANAQGEDVVAGRSFSALLRSTLELARPLVAIGAPVGAYYHEVARRLGAALSIPPHAAVCNAVGAVAGVVSQTAEILVNQPTLKVFRVHDPAGSRDFADPEPAIEHARTVSRALALAAARRAGAVDPHVETSVHEQRAHIGPDTDYLAEAVARSTATGRPHLGHFST